MADDKKLDRIEAKVDLLTEKVWDINSTLHTNTGILDEHQRRSKANEEAIQLMRQEFEPVKKHVIMWGVIGKVGAWVAGAAAFLAALVEIASFFMK